MCFFGSTHVSVFFLVQHMYTKKLKRLQTIDKRRAKALLMMARQVKDNMFKKIEVVGKKNYP